MNLFAKLYTDLDASTSTSHKIGAMAAYFAVVPPEDGAWAVYFLAGGRPGRPIPSKQLRLAIQQASGLPEWLIEESYQAVGDLAETLAHLLAPAREVHDIGLAEWMNTRLSPVRHQSPEAQRDAVISWWRQSDASTLFVLNKLLTGGMRVGVSRLLVQRALAQAFDLDPKLIAQRMMGYNDKTHHPQAASFNRLIAAPADTPEALAAERALQPYPFYLAHPLPPGAQMPGAAQDWLAEWKWDGIRGQLIRRLGKTWIWSRGEELMTERFPELAEPAAALPDGTVLDGELLCWDHEADQVLPFAMLQKRIGRKTLPARLLAQAPVVFMSYDLLESDGVDVRALQQSDRRQGLEALFASLETGASLQLSPLLQASDWDGLGGLRESARALGVEGLMLKHRAAPYGVGRVKASDGAGWWKWKLDPMTVDCVLIYAQPGHGRRAGLYTDYTFAVWDSPPGNSERRLVPFAKAYSGLSDEEIARVDKVIRKTTREKFGPVRSVDPSLVFELGFEAIQASGRHKSGLAVRFPRMLRERPDKTIDQADTLETLRALLPG